MKNIVLVGMGLALAAAGSIQAQTPVPIGNPSFEDATVLIGDTNFEDADFVPWTRGFDGVPNTYAGIANVPTHYNSLPDVANPQTVQVYFNQAEVRQALQDPNGVLQVFEANTTYKLEFDLGHTNRGDNPDVFSDPYVRSWRVELQVDGEAGVFDSGSTLTRASQLTSGVPAIAGDWLVDEVLWYTTGASGPEIGKTIEIALRGGAAASYDNFSLTKQAATATTYNLTVTSNIAGALVSPPLGVNAFPENQRVICTASRSPDCPSGVFELVQWTIDGEDATDPYAADPNAVLTEIEVLMDGDHTVHAEFAAAEAFCGDECHPYPDGDYNQDCKVDYLDLPTLEQNWMIDNRPVP